MLLPISVFCRYHRSARRCSTRRCIACCRCRVLRGDYCRSCKFASQKYVVSIGNVCVMFCALRFLLRTIAVGVFRKVPIATSLYDFVWQSHAKQFRGFHVYSFLRQSPQPVVVLTCALIAAPLCVPLF